MNMLLNALILLSICNLCLLAAVIYERKTSDNRLNNAFDRIMAKDYGEYATEKYRMAKLSPDSQTAEDYVKQFATREDMLADLEAKGLLASTVVPVD